LAVPEIIALNGFWFIAQSFVKPQASYFLCSIKKAQEDFVFPGLDWNFLGEM